MKNKFKYHVLNMKCQVALLAIMLLFACNNSSNWKETESGLQYIIHLDKKGTKAHIGDGLQLHLIYKNAFDSVLYDSKVLGNAFVMELTEPLFQGSIEEGFAMMGEGDSASFLVVADSVYKNVFQTVMPPQMAPGMRLRIDVRINKILTPTQYKAFIKEQQGPQGDETTLIQKYMADNQVSGSPDANGLYFISFVDGIGKQPQKGNICEVSYLVRALSGQVFDASEKGYTFTMGDTALVKGWNQGIGMMKEGGKARIIVPASLGYGAAGSEKIPPHTTLVFDVDLIKVD